jgi:hypothetical protein
MYLSSQTHKPNVSWHEVQPLRREVQPLHEVQEPASDSPERLRTCAPAVYGLSYTLP